jgi:hypothetical protein
MYAFRKPFNNGLYEGMTLLGVGYKSVLIISQVCGYMISKFWGIKIISELKSVTRIKLIVGLIMVAELALLFFGLVPFPFNFIFLFFNGLPLGMVYGVVFSFLEGRRFTEMIAMGLSVSIIVASGVLKTVYLEVHLFFPWISEFWMPFAIGFIFFPMFGLFVWMLSVIPDPTEEDLKMRCERQPMTNDDKRSVLKVFGFPILCFVICYSLLGTARDFRDNFTIEIWNEIESGWESSILSQTEFISGFIILLIIGSTSIFKSNLLGFRYVNLVVLLGLIISGLTTLLFQYGIVNGYHWMLLVGVGMFLSYTAIQTVLFDRMIALYQIKANAGFFVYICDSFSYLGSVLLLVYKEFFMNTVSWSKVLIQFTYIQSIIGLALLGGANLFFHFRAVRMRKIASSRNIVNQNTSSVLP